jgi:hypothetical protein
VPTGCKCKQCFGLREYLQDKGLEHRDLPAAPGHPTLPTRAICSGTYGCHCVDCQLSRRRTVKHVRQPWEVA